MSESTSEESFPPFLPSFKAEVKAYLRDTLSRTRQEAIIQRYQAALQRAKQDAAQEAPPKTAEEIEKVAQENAQKTPPEAGEKIEKVTQEDMAALLHITPRAYGDLERGRSNFSAITLIIFLAKLPSNEQAAILRAFAEILSKREPSVSK